MIQYLIVSRQGTPNPPSESLALTCLLIIMPGPAFVAAEFLVCPTVSYPVPALQTYWNMSLKLLVIHNGLTFIPANMVRQNRYSNNLMKVFTFLKKVFLFLII